MEQKKSEFNKVLNAWDVLVIAFGAMIGWGWVVSTGGWIEKGGVLGVVFFAFCKKKYKESFGTLVELISDEDAATLMPEADEVELDKVIDAAIDRVLAKKAS